LQSSFLSWRCDHYPFFHWHLLGPSTKWAFFALGHSQAFHKSMDLFPSYLFLFVANNTSIINFAFIIHHAFNYFTSQLGLVRLMVQPSRCIA
jgi:hypothetical protein